MDLDFIKPKSWGSFLNLFKQLLKHPDLMRSGQGKCRFSWQGERASAELGTGLPAPGEVCPPFGSLLWDHLTPYIRGDLYGRDLLAPSWLGGNLVGRAGLHNLKGKL